MITMNSLGAVFYLPLALILWQGSSCHSSNSPRNANSARNGKLATENTNVNANGTNMNANNISRAAPVDLIGIWGGAHIVMEITASGARLDYDCAHGSITEKIVPGRDGSFSVKGLHAREHPGPIRDGEETDGESASYRGSIKGDAMELTVTLSRSNEAVGSFTLTRGKSGRLRKCL